MCTETWEPIGLVREAVELVKDKGVSGGGRVWEGEGRARAGGSEKVLVRPREQPASLGAVVCRFHLDMRGDGP